MFHVADVIITFLNMIPDLFSFAWSMYIDTQERLGLMVFVSLLGQLLE